MLLTMNHYRSIKHFGQRDGKGFAMAIVYIDTAPTYFSYAGAVPCAVGYAERVISLSL